MKYPLTALPSLIIPVALYGLAALFGGGHERFAAGLETAALTVPMPAGVDWSLSWGELFVLAGLAALFFDLIKATGTGTATLINHALSIGVFVLCLVVFLLAPPFVTSPFFLLMVMTLLDVVAGFIITIISSRRDVSYNR